MHAYTGRLRCSIGTLARVSQRFQATKNSAEAAADSGQCCSAPCIRLLDRLSFCNRMRPGLENNTVSLFCRKTSSKDPRPSASAFCRESTKWAGSRCRLCPFFARFACVTAIIFQHMLDGDSSSSPYGSGLLHQKVSALTFAPQNATEFTFAPQNATESAHPNPRIPGIAL
jgi:hypothetical protein